MDDLDDLEPQEGDPAPEAAEAGPTLADLKKLRSENKGLRERLKEAQNLVLTTRFTSEVLELIPEEVTDFDRRVTLAEQFTTRLNPSSTAAQTDQATTESPQAELTEDEEAIAAVAKGATGGGSSKPTITRDEFRAMMADPSQRAAALQAAKENRVQLNNPEAANAFAGHIQLQ